MKTSPPSRLASTASDAKISRLCKDYALFMGSADDIRKYSLARPTLHIDDQTIILCSNFVYTFSDSGWIPFRSSCTYDSLHDVEGSHPCLCVRVCVDEVIKSWKPPHRSCLEEEPVQSPTSTSFLPEPAVVNVHLPPDGQVAA